MSPPVRTRTASLVALAVAATLLAGAATAGCADDPPPAVHRFAPLDSDGRHFRDRDGRAVLLRGVNARVAGVFDVTFDDGRAPLEPLPAFSAADATRMRALGINLLRLPLSWSALEPAPGAYAAPYLDRVAAVVDLCRAAGLYVLLDLHQDAWSKEIGEDGAPLWAILPAPTTHLGGPLTDLDARRASTAAMAASKSFFTDDAASLQERFAAMAAHLAARFRGDGAVVGYEIFNEPIATDAELLPFHRKVATAIRAADPDHLIAFEPSVTRNFTNATAHPDAAFSIAGAVYAPHVYTAIFGNDARLASGAYVEVLASSIAAAREEADGWGTPLLISEWGASPADPHTSAWIGHFLDGADDALASHAFWLWKEESQARWGLFDAHDGDGSFTERADLVALVTRPHPLAIGGDPVRIQWSAAARTLTVRYRVRKGTLTRSDLHVGAASATATATCDGAPVAVTLAAAASTTVVVDCGTGAPVGSEHVVTVAVGP